jgi:AcrR family transcriptional regulator
VSEQNINDEDITQLIAAKIELSGMSVREIAAHAQISHSALYRFLNGESALRHDGFVAVLACLGIDLGPVIRKSLRINPAKEVEDVSESFGTIYSALNEFKRRAFIRSALTFASLNLNLDSLVSGSMRRLKKIDRSISTHRDVLKK